ncbi:MAG: signal peptidase I [Clostridiales bacterium]|nr:signal peptidase I [Clostridiales bacterium]
MRRRSQGLAFNDKKRTISQGLVREIMLWIATTIITAALAVFVVHYFGLKVSVIGQSMEPLLTNGQNVLIDSMTYKLVGIHKGDVIAFYPGGNTSAHPYIKRVAGVPGDVIQIVDGELLVNGVPDGDSSEYDKMGDAGIAENAMTLENNEYFVLGDNRNNSEDSRSAGIGAVTDSMIIGKAWLSLPSGDSGMSFIGS